MSCSLADVRIKFETSGLELAPYELDLRIDRGKFDHCRARVTKSAGRLVAGELADNPNEPVDIFASDGKLLRRMYIPANGVELGKDEAWLTFYDPLHLLTQGMCNKTFTQGITLQDVMDYIFDNIADPNEVITDYNITDPAFADNIQPNYQDLRQNSLYVQAEDYAREQSQVDGLFGDAGNVIQSNLADYFSLQADSVLWTNRVLNKYLGVHGDIGTLDFDEKSPHEALKQVADEWELDYWVDQEGVLWIGRKETNPTIHIANPSPRTLTISEYNIIPQPLPVAEVIVRGGKTRLGLDRNHDGESDTYRDVKNRGVMTYGQARVDNAANGRTITVQNKKLHNGEALKNAAERRLLNELVGNMSGNIKLNPDYSGFTDFSRPNELDLGDYLLVNGYEQVDECKEEVVSGEFMINSVHHDIKGSKGWDITIEATHVPTKEINSRFFYYRPEENEIVDEDDLYINMYQTTAQLN